MDSFIRCIFEGYNFYRMYFKGCIFIRWIFEGYNFIGCILKDAFLKDVTLIGYYFFIGCHCISFMMDFYMPLWVLKFDFYMMHFNRMMHFYRIQAIFIMGCICLKDGFL